MRIDIGGRIGSLGDLHYTAAALARDVEACRLDCVLVANIAAASDSVGGENRDEADANWETLRVCEHNPRLRPLYWARPGQVDHNLFAVAGALAHEPFVGVVLSPEHNDLALTDPDLAPLIQVCARLRLPIVVPVGGGPRAGAAAVVAAARANPKVSWVLHGGTQPPHHQVTADLLRRVGGDSDAHIFVDTAGCPSDRLVPLLRAVGTHRILFGSDAGNAAPNARGIAPNQIQVLQQDLAPDIFQQVMGDNAARIFSRLTSRLTTRTAASPAGQSPVGQAPVGQSPVGRAPVGQAPVGRASVPARAPLET